MISKISKQLKKDAGKQAILIGFEAAGTTETVKKTEFKQFLDYFNTVEMVNYVLLKVVLNGKLANCINFVVLISHHVNFLK